MKPKSPVITDHMKEKYPGNTIISLDGEILGIGTDPLLALQAARKIMGDIDSKEFMISSIRYPILCA